MKEFSVGLSREPGKADQNPPQLVIPEDLESSLAAHPQIKARFDRLPPSHRKQYVEWISEAKRPETRLKRINETLSLIQKELKDQI